MSLTTSVALRWSEQTRTSDSTGSEMSPSSRAGTWWSAAATRDRGTAACTEAATDPLGGTSGWNSLATRASALHMQMTTLPLSWSATCMAVAAAASHGVASTTTSAPAAVALSPKSMGSWRSGHFSSRWSRASIARYFDLEPTITS